jgi:hypothetical protein
MSFSSQVKEEILNKISRKKENMYLPAESFGEYLTQASFKNDLNEEFGKYFKIEKLTEKEIKAILKGAFLSSGYIADPNLDYQLEINFKNKACADFLYNLLSVLEFTPRLLKRKNSKLYSLYLKDSNQISTFLGMIEVDKAVLEFEKVRVEKEVKNNINRNINCETANFAKTIKSSLKQIEAINKIKDNNLFDNLNEKLKYTAKLRLKYPNESLEFISNQTKNKDYITKSGLKHRLDKIIQIAQNL